MNRTEIVTKLFQMQDFKYRDFHSNLCPGLNNIIGVRTPALRKLAKEILYDNPQEFLTHAQNEYYEETLLEGLVIAGLKIPLSEKLQLLQSFVPKINNWATCDLTCASFKFKDADLPQVWNFILQYQNSSAEFERRFMLVMMMDHFLTSEYLTQIFGIINQIQTDQYYVNMAIAWLVSTSFVKHRDVTLKFLQNNNLSPWVQNKSIQKIRESLRVSDTDKTVLLQLKR